MINTIQQQFEHMVELYPDKVALVRDTDKMNYSDLNAQANQLAQYLICQGVKPGHIVAMLIDPSFSMIITLLAILKAGAVYLPLDQKSPKLRLQKMLMDSAVELVIVQDMTTKLLPSGNHKIISLCRASCEISAMPDKNINLSMSSDDLAYINYTSGSTGEPKGVQISHKSVLRLLFDANYARFDETRVFLQLSTISFDAATFEVWGGLLHGGKCCIYAPNFLSLATLKSTIRDNGVTTVFLTTALFNTIIDEDIEVVSSIDQLLTGGEAHSVNHMRKAVDGLANTEVICVYGPTESTTFATFYPVSCVSQQCTSIPIGRAISNTQAYVLNNDNQLVDIGEIGELCLAGPGLSLGYLNKPEHNDKSFITGLEFLDKRERIYRTGDLVKCQLDGNLIYIGRKDDQVKIRGFRVTIGEIESALLLHTDVNSAVVIVDSNSSSESQLLAFVVSSSSDLTKKKLKMHLKEYLPSYMIPEKIHFVKSMPLTLNGKVDRVRLSLSV